MMKIFLLLLLLFAIMGEVSGSFQTGVPSSVVDAQVVQGAATEANNGGTGQLIFSALIAVAAVVTMVLIMQHER